MPPNQYQNSCSAQKLSGPPRDEEVAPPCHDWRVATCRRRPDDSPRNWRSQHIGQRPTHRSVGDDPCLQVAGWNHPGQGGPWKRPGKRPEVSQRDPPRWRISTKDPGRSKPSDSKLSPHPNLTAHPSRKELEAVWIWIATEALPCDRKSSRWSEMINQGFQALISPNKGAKFYLTSVREPEILF